VYDRIVCIKWVGRATLEVEFVVTDAGTGEPIPGAVVEIAAHGGIGSREEKGEFALSTDASGAARRSCHVMSFGTRSKLGFTDTFAVHLPDWDVRIMAAGFEPTPRDFWDAEALRLQVRRVGPGRAKLVVPMSLSRRELTTP
jgi:hypothetical protein